VVVNNHKLLALVMLVTVTVMAVVVNNHKLLALVMLVTQVISISNVGDSNRDGGGS